MGWLNVSPHRFYFSDQHPTMCSFWSGPPSHRLASCPVAFVKGFVLTGSQRTCA